MEELIGVLWGALHLILYTSIFIYFLKDRKTYSFVRGFFITACSLSIAGELFYMLIYRLRIEAFAALFDFVGGPRFIRPYFLWTGAFLLVYGITFLIGSEYNREEIKTELPAMKGTRRDIGISLLLFVVTLGIYFYFHLIFRF